MKNEKVEIIEEILTDRISEIEEDLNLCLSDNVEQKAVIIKEILKQNEVGQVEKSAIEEKSKEYLENFKEKEEVREHKYLQTFVKKIAEQRGFKANIEEIVENGRIDVSFARSATRPMED